MTEYHEPKRPETMTAQQLIARVHALEATLMPFAMVSLAMSDARIRLAAAGREDEPAGGHWVNNVKSTAMTPSEIYFYTALDVRGRAAVEEHMLRQMDRVVELTTESQEKADAIDKGARADH